MRTVYLTQGKMRVLASEARGTGWSQITQDPEEHIQAKGKHFKYFKHAYVMIKFISEKSPSAL